MKKSTIAIIIISAVLVLGILTAGGIMILKSLGSMMGQLPDDFFAEEGTENETEKAISDAVSSVSGSFSAPYWAETIETGYSYEIFETLRSFQNKPVVFTGTLTDLVFENGKYIVLLQDRNDEIKPSVAYWIECTEEQKTSLAENKENESSYNIFTAAITPTEVITTPLDYSNAWSPEIIVKGNLLGYEATQVPYEYY